MRDALEEARQQVAALVGAAPREVVFTSGGTEAINAAVWGATRQHPGAPVLFADVEHSAVREASSRLAPDRGHPGRRGRRASTPARSRPGCSRRRSPDRRWCTASGPTTKWGRCSRCTRSSACAGPPASRCTSTRRPPAVTSRWTWPIWARTSSVSAPTKSGASPAPARSSSVAAAGSSPSSSGASRNGRAGADSRRYRPCWPSGPRRRRWAPTAQRLLHDEADRARAHLAALTSAATSVEGVEIVGPPQPDQRLPSLLCLGVHGVEAEPVLIGLDRAGVAVHSGSACSSESIEPSPVLEAMGVDANHSLRVSVGWSTTDDDVAAFGTAFARGRGRAARLTGLTSSLSSLSSSTPSRRRARRGAVRAPASTPVRSARRSS